MVLHFITTCNESYDGSRLIFIFIAEFSLLSTGSCTLERKIKIKKRFPASHLPTYLSPSISKLNDAIWTAS